MGQHVSCGSTERPAVPRAGSEAGISKMLQAMEAVGAGHPVRVLGVASRPEAGWKGGGVVWPFSRREPMEPVQASGQRGK